MNEWLKFTLTYMCYHVLLFCVPTPFWCNETENRVFQGTERKKALENVTD